MKTEPKTLKGAIQYEIVIEDGDINLRFEQSNENHLIAFEMVRKITQEMLAGGLNPPKECDTVIEFLSKQIPILGKYVMDKYKDAVPEEKKVKILKFDPMVHKLPNLKK